MFFWGITKTRTSASYRRLSKAKKLKVWNAKLTQSPNIFKLKGSHSLSSFLFYLLSNFYKNWTPIFIFFTHYESAQFFLYFRPKSWICPKNAKKWVSPLKSTYSRANDGYALCSSFVIINLDLIMFLFLPKAKFERKL